LNDELEPNPEFVLSTNPEETTLHYDTIAEHIQAPLTKGCFDGNMTPARLQEYATTKIKPNASSFGIACFTMCPMSEELWNIQSKNSKGVCLHFDRSDDQTFFHNILPKMYVSPIKRSRKFQNLENL